MKSIAERLRHIRENLGVGQVDAASKFGIPVSTYRKYESGPSEPGAEAIAGITRAGINANWLLTGEGEMLLADYRARIEAERKESFGDAPDRIGNTLPPHMMEVLKREMVKPENQPPSSKYPPGMQKAMRQYGIEDDSIGMAGVTAPDSAVCGAIDQSLLQRCLSACSSVYGEAFDNSTVAVQLEYAVDLYNVLVKVSPSLGGMDKLNRLELKGTTDFMKLLNTLGSLRKFPPSVLDDYF